VILFISTPWTFRGRTLFILRQPKVQALTAIQDYMNRPKYRQIEMQIRSTKSVVITIAASSALNLIIAIMLSLNAGNYGVILLNMLAVGLGASALWLLLCFLKATSADSQRLRGTFAAVEAEIIKAESASRGVDSQANQEPLEDVRRGLGMLRQLLRNLETETRASMSIGTRLSEAATKSGNEASSGLQSALEQTTRVRSELAVMNEMMQGIVSKTQQIDEIVLKTSILSFNASIEAARAGASGRQFSVIASQMTALAGQIKGAAEDINKLLANTELKVESIVMLAAATGMTFERAATQFTQAYRDLLSGLPEVSEHLNRISESSPQLQSEIDKASEALERIDATDKHNSTTAQQATLAVRKALDLINGLVVPRHALFKFPFESSLNTRSLGTSKWQG